MVYPTVTLQGSANTGTLTVWGDDGFVLVSAPGMQPIVLPEPEVRRAVQMLQEWIREREEEGGDT